MGAVVRSRVIPATKKRPWTRQELRELKAHSRNKTPVRKISRDLKRTIGSLRVKASSIGIGLGHQQR
jgi:hypothetical protein